MSRSTKLKGALAGSVCVTVGAAAGIAGAGAAPGTHTVKVAPAVPPAMRTLPWRRFGVRPGRGLIVGGPAVHAEAVVPNRAGTGFITVTSDAGTVQSLSGDKLTIKEGVGKLTYRTVTLSIPSGATVVRDFAKSTLGALRSGDRVRVTRSSEGTFVIAGDGAHLKWRLRPPGAPPGLGPQARPGGAPPLPAPPALPGA